MTATEEKTHAKAVAVSLAMGRTRDETARHLGLSPTTVSRILKQIYQETGTTNTTAAMVILARRGDLDEVPDPGHTVPDLRPDTPVQEAVWRRLVVSDLDWRTFRDLRQAYEILCRAGV